MNTALSCSFCGKTRSALSGGGITSSRHSSSEGRCAPAASLTAHQDPCNRFAEIRPLDEILHMSIQKGAAIDAAPLSLDAITLSARRISRPCITEARTAPP